MKLTKFLLVFSLVVLCRVVILARQFPRVCRVVFVYVKAQAVVTLGQFQEYNHKILMLTYFKTSLR